MSAIGFFVPGRCGTKGSVRAIPTAAGGSFVKNDSDRAEAWTALVTMAARRVMSTRAPLTGALDVEIRFYLARPKKWVRKDGSLKPGAPMLVSSKPDGDKLERCTWDALTGIVFTDDSQIARWSGEKRYADAPQSIGADILVMEADRG